MTWHRRIPPPVDAEGPDPVDLPYEPRDLKPGEEQCAHRGCLVPIMRYGGCWYHVAKADKHRARPIPRNGGARHD